MPSRNSIKQFMSDGTYHVYNRGVAKQNIFNDKQDYEAFMRRLMLVLLPLEDAEKLQKGKSRIRLANLHGLASLQAFCLMPNHFHLMLRQYEEPTAITKLMTTLTTSYSMYFNRKYERVGPLFQGRFKASWVNNETYLVHLNRYIHCNPMKLVKDIYNYEYSSLKYYFGEPKNWLDTTDIEGMFESEEQYIEFINDLQDMQAEAELYEL